MHSTGAAAAATLTASDLRNTLNRLLGEHRPPMNATNLEITGSKSFPAAAKALDGRLGRAVAGDRLDLRRQGREDVPRRALSQWRAHVKFFVDYTVALAKRT